MLITTTPGVGTTSFINADVTASSGSIHGGDRRAAGVGKIENLSKAKSIKKFAKSKKSDYIKTKFIE